jgi:phytoene synthase
LSGIRSLRAAGPVRPSHRVFGRKATDVDVSYQLCRDVTKHHSKTFYLASLFLRTPQRRAIWSVYAFCRTADDMVDRHGPAVERLASLDAWQEHVVAAFEGKPRHPLTVALADSVQRYGIPLGPALQLIEGARRDVNVLRYQTYEDLREYCYLVASTVGLLTCPVLGCEQEALEYGAALGRAMQMTNILRDVGEDARMGRIYLPAEDMERFEYSERSLFAGTIDANFIALMQFEIARVRAMYDAAAPGIELLAPGSRYAVRLALTLYRGILDQIERNGFDVFTRRAALAPRAKFIAAMTTTFEGLARGGDQPGMTGRQGV